MCLLERGYDRHAVVGVFVQGGGPGGDDVEQDKEFPFGGLLVLDIETTDGKVCSAQSNAILRFAGRLSGLYPVDDPLLALKVDEVLVHKGGQI